MALMSGLERRTVILARLMTNQLQISLCIRMLRWLEGEELNLKVLVATMDAQWEGMGGCRVDEVRAGTTSPMPDHKGFTLQ